MDQIPYFSKFVYKGKTSGKLKTVHIEPLATMLRHPLFCADFKKYEASPGVKWGKTPDDGSGITKYNTWYLKDGREFMSSTSLLKKDWLLVSWNIGEQASI